MPFKPFRAQIRLYILYIVACHAAMPQHRRSKYSWSKSPWLQSPSNLGLPHVEDLYNRSALGEAECGDRFNSLLVHLNRRGNLRAKHICCLAFWAVGAGCWSEWHSRW